MTAPRDAWKVAWRGMGWWRWLCLALVIVAFVLLPQELAR